MGINRIRIREAKIRFDLGIPYASVINNDGHNIRERQKSSLAASVGLDLRDVHQDHQSSFSKIPPAEQAPRMVKNDWLESDPLFVVFTLSTLVTSF